MDFLMEHASRLRGEELLILSSIAAPYLRGIAQTFNRGDLYHQAWATRILGTFGLPVYRPYLLSALSHRSPHVVMTAFRCLIAYGDPQSFDILVWSLSRFEKWNRNLLALLVASIGKNSIEVIRKGFEDESQPYFVRVILCTALREMGDIPSADIAAKILRKKTHIELAFACIRLIRNLGGKQHADLIRSLCGQENKMFRAQAIRAIGRLGDETDLPLLKAGLDDPSPWVALYCATALKDIHMEPLLKEIARSNHPRAALASQVLELS